MASKQFRNCTFSIGKIPQKEKDAIDYCNDFIERMQQHTNNRGNKSIDYMIISLEKGEENGHYHIQGYCHSKTSRRAENWRNILDGAYYTVRSGGTPQENIDYISKEDTHIYGPLSFGDIPPNENKRTDVEEFIEAIKQGKNDLELLNEFPVQFLRYEGKIARIRNVSAPSEKKYNKKEVYYLWGSTGTGKSRWYHEKYDMNDVYVVNSYDRGAFDGYQGESVLVLEEYRGGFSEEFFLQLLDGYYLTLPARYYNRVARFNTVVICSNIPINKLYKECEIKTINAMKRRITKTIHFEKKSTCYKDAIKMFGNKVTKKTIFEKD